VEVKMKLEMFKDRIGKWRCRLVFNNGHIFMSSEAYSSKGMCRKSCQAFIRKAWRILEIEEV
jgi:uncharacterized protein YegP (UPF0339 family)